MKESEIKRINFLLIHPPQFLGRYPFWENCVSPGYTGKVHRTYTVAVPTEWRNKENYTYLSNREFGQSNASWIHRWIREAAVVSSIMSWRKEEIWIRWCVEERNDWIAYTYMRIGWSCCRRRWSRLNALKCTWFFRWRMKEEEMIQLQVSTNF